MASATVFVPGSIGNVGPGFDVLGLAIDGLGDQVKVELADGPSAVISVTGRDAALVPIDPKSNCAVIAANSLLARRGDPRGARVSIDRSLPLAGGLGASAAASVGGALAAALALGGNISEEQILLAALAGEEAVAGRHLDNIAPSLLGGLAVVISTDPPFVTKAKLSGEWWISVVTPAQRLATKKARSVLPTLVTQADFVAQMAYTSGLITAFAKGDYDLARRSLCDLYAEPRRAHLIPAFPEVKAAALAAGALGCSISGAGPSIFALCASEKSAQTAASAMRQAFWPIEATIFSGRVSERGAYRL